MSVHQTESGKAHREKILVVMPDEDDGDGDGSIPHDNKTGIAMLEIIYAEQGLFQNKENELPTALSADGILEEGTIEDLEGREENERSLVATGIAKAGQVMMVDGCDDVRTYVTRAGPKFVGLFQVVAAGILKSAEIASAAISRS